MSKILSDRRKIGKSVKSWFELVYGSLLELNDAWLQMLSHVPIDVVGGVRVHHNIRSERALETQEGDFPAVVLFEAAPHNLEANGLFCAGESIGYFLPKLPAF